MTTYNTNLASEYYVLSMLRRLGFEASLTLGNKKSVDIVVVRDSGDVATIDVKGRWRDNIMVERLWRTMKYDCIYLHAYETGSETRKGLQKWFRKYNQERPHSSLEDRTPYGHTGICSGPYTRRNWLHDRRWFPP